MSEEAQFKEPKITINRVYTKQGDTGQTRLVGGQSIQKHALRIECYGTVDELNAFLGSCAIGASEIGLEETVLDVGGLERKIRVFRLPKSNPHRTLSAQVKVPLKPDRDNPLWVCVTTEDGFQAWSSPIYAFR